MAEQVLADGRPRGRTAAPRAERAPRGRAAPGLLGWLWTAVHPLRDNPQSLNSQLEGSATRGRTACFSTWRGCRCRTLALGTLGLRGTARPAVIGHPDAARLRRALAQPHCRRGSLGDGARRAADGLPARPSSPPLGGPGDLDRTTAALLDAATHRLDPWAVALAWRRLTSRNDAKRVLGLYGYVDGPFRGRARPRRPRRHARPLARPGEDSGDRAGPSRRTPPRRARPRDRHDVSLDSERVGPGTAGRPGSPSGGASRRSMGREFERLLPSTPVVRDFRNAYPAHRTDAGRRTCDGLKAAPR